MRSSFGSAVSASRLRANSAIAENGIPGLNLVLIAHHKEHRPRVKRFEAGSDD